MGDGQEEAPAGGRARPKVTPRDGMPHVLALDRQFQALVAEHENLDYGPLLKELGVGAPSNDRLTFDPKKIEYYSRIEDELKLTKAERRMYAERGIVNVDHQQRYSMGSAYYAIWARDLPVLVTTDSILHAMHRSYDEMLKQLETWVFTTILDDTLQHLHRRIGVELGKTRDPALTTSLRDLDVYVAVARSLLSGAGAAKDEYGSYPQHMRERLEAESQLVATKARQDSKVAKLLADISSLQMQLPPLKTKIYGGARAIDYSQFRPRGHYTKSPKLKRYFRAMMWLGRADTGFILKPPESQSLIGSNVERERRNAALITMLLDKSRKRPQLESMSKVIDYLVGKADDVGVGGAVRALRLANLNDVADLAPPEATEAFAQALGKSAQQSQIRSQVLGSPPAGTTRTPIPPTFQLFGQRFVIDSFVLSKVVFDSILYENEKQQRMMPRGLDVMAALGSDEAVRLLRPDLERYQYSANLLAARRTTEGYLEKHGGDSAYNRWLRSLTKLDDVPTPSTHVPEVMRTTAWQRKMLQTQLASWSELRHDTILYAKQSYSAFPSCEYPDAYVEPYPRFFAAVRALTEDAAQRLGSMDLSSLDDDLESEAKNRLLGFVAHFDRFSGIVARLESLAKKELRAQPFTDTEREFLEHTIQVSSGGSGPPRYDGWYPKLFYRAADSQHWDPTVSDVHTNPEPPSVLETAVGSASFLVVAIDNEKDRAAYVGPVYSYYEFSVGPSQRMTDQEWQRRISSGRLPPRPKWAKTFVPPPKRRGLDRPSKHRYERSGGRVGIPELRKARARYEQYLAEIEDDLGRKRVQREIERVDRRIDSLRRPFRRGDVLDVAAKKTQECAPADSEIRKGTAMVEFDPKGHVHRFSIHPRELREHEAFPCFERVYSKLRVAPFGGYRVTQRASLRCNACGESSVPDELQRFLRRSAPDAAPPKKKKSAASTSLKPSRRPKRRAPRQTEP